MEPSLIPEIEELLMLKKNSSEMGLAPKRQRLNDYIEQNLVYLKTEADRLPSMNKKSWEPLNDAFLSSLSVAGRIKDIRVERWAGYESIRGELPKCDNCPAYESAIKSAVISSRIRYTGKEHKCRPDGAPVFSDGTCMLYSMRDWGDLMADIWSDTDGRDYDYMDFYM